MDSEVLTTGQAAALLGVSVRTLQRYDTRDLLPAYRTPKHRRYYLRDDVLRFKKKHYAHIGSGENEKELPL